MTSRPNKLPWIAVGDYEDTRKCFVATDDDPETGDVNHCIIVLWAGKSRRLVIPIPRFIHHCPDWFVTDRFGDTWSHNMDHLIRHNDAKTIDVDDWNKHYRERWWRR